MRLLRDIRGYLREECYTWLDRVFVLFIAMPLALFIFGWQWARNEIFRKK